MPEHVFNVYQEWIHAILAMGFVSAFVQSSTISSVVHAHVRCSGGAESSIRFGTGIEIHRD